MEETKRLLIRLTKEQQKGLKKAVGLEPDARCEFIGIRLTEDVLDSLRRGDDGGDLVVYAAPGNGGGTVIG